MHAYEDAFWQDHLFENFPNVTEQTNFGYEFFDEEKLETWIVLLHRSHI